MPEEIEMVSNPSTHAGMPVPTLGGPSPLQPGAGARASWWDAPEAPAR